MISGFQSAHHLLVHMYRLEGGVSLKLIRPGVSRSSRGLEPLLEKEDSPKGRWSPRGPVGTIVQLFGAGADSGDSPGSLSHKHHQAPLARDGLLHAPWHSCRAELGEDEEVGWESLGDLDSDGALVRLGNFQAA